ncbi:MAG: hypothetical protein ACREPG_00995 [Candidatus Binatia bacterium]
MTETLEANVQYNDLVGSAALDGHTGGDLWRMLEENGIDTKKELPVGYRFFYLEGYASLTVYLARTDVVGSSYDDLKKYIARGSGKLPVRKAHIDKVSFKSLAKYVKRFEVCFPGGKELANLQFDVHE